MAKIDYITSGYFRLMVYQSDIQNASSSDPYVNVTVYLQTNLLIAAGATGNFTNLAGSLLGGAYTYSGYATLDGRITDWTTIATIFSSKGIWSVSKTRTAFNVSLTGTYGVTNPQRSGSISLSGTVSMQAWPVSGTKDTMSVASSMTMGTAYTISITHKTSGNKNTLTYSFGGSSGTILRNSTATSVSFTPPTSLGARIPSATSGRITFTLTTYNSSGTGLGSTTYTSTLNVPSYSLSAPTVSAAKASYTGIGAYVANKTKTRFTLGGLPSGSYGATVTGSYTITLAGLQQTSGTKTGTSASTVDYTPAGAGTLTLKYTIKDSRGKSAHKSVSVTYVANKAPTIKFTAARDSTTLTNWTGSVSGTYLDVSGNTPTITYSAGTATAPTASGGSYSGGSVSGTLEETSSLSVKATVTDSLGNTASKTVTISTVFAYIEATPNRVISIGRKASTSESDKVQIGLPVDVEGALSEIVGGVVRARLNDEGIIFRNSNGSLIGSFSPPTITQLTPSNSSLTLQNATVVVFSLGSFGIVRINMQITGGFNTETYYDLCDIGRTLGWSAYQLVPNQTGNSAALIEINAAGTLRIYRYSGSNAFTGWMRTNIPVVFSS